MNEKTNPLIAAFRSCLYNVAIPQLYKKYDDIALDKENDEISLFGIIFKFDFSIKEHDVVVTLNIINKESLYKIVPEIRHKVQLALLDVISASKDIARKINRYGSNHNQHKKDA